MTLICGHSRAGKTTYSQRYECKVLHFDNICSYTKIINEVKKAESDIVVEGIYYGKEQRAELCKAYNGKSVCIFLDTSTEVREERMGRKILHPYPFNAPTLSEGWDEIIIIRGEHEQRINRQTEN